MTNNCKFFILAGGYGKRARPLSLIKPKPLFPLAGTPLIEILLVQLVQKGLHQGFINLHHLPQLLRQSVEEITEKGMSLPTLKKLASPVIQFLYEKNLSGSRILKEAAEKMTDDELLLVVNGDIFLEIPIEKMLEKILTDQSDGILLVRKNKERDSQYKVILTRGDEFAGRKIFSSSDREYTDEPLMYTGVSLFKRKVVRAIDEINFFDMLEKSHFEINTFNYNGIWLDIGDPKSYLASDSIFKKHLGMRNSNSISGNVFISADSTVKDCIIWENTRIENKSFIKSCIVTGNVSLADVHYEHKIINRDSVEEGILL